MSTVSEQQGAAPTAIWHDEIERWERTGHLDQGPCWCEDCLPSDARP